MAVLLNEEEMAAAVDRLAEQILENTEGPLCIVGIRSRGDEVAERVCNRLAETERELNYGVLDISLYRDDLEHLNKNPKLQSSEISFPMDGAHVILVDDVLFTGRTIRAALDALTDYGRPQKVELAVLIDRGWRELPIEPNYVGKKLETKRMDRVVVKLHSTDGEDLVELQENN
ncbi:bifunctional pyr operon transcriptional regulator/uracil phosphoribosyltransferase PyrR [Roseibacillus ishigakijimensis]|uniref:Bifunctional protein PyrR n=1 Tax=Roseibacillus ishigakijimensis TaxID=454146 RepID=A0A934RR38_9BACT|nr:bifunctional pyr operon transcriptional regulator/uracil phosphoribosyltransferase PyrR [Roseibacillus ishigakijimensis]MBK1834086.1 bifunctional pyr operon transcriptional regulator/uracil phosphoribosyltransferase PyrR [Roseibacillus ishigakijimensis]